MPGAGALRITLVRSTIGRPKDQEATVRALGLRRMHQTVERPDTASTRGMVIKIRHLVRVEELAADESAAPSGSSKEKNAPSGTRFRRNGVGEGDGTG